MSSVLELKEVLDANSTSRYFVEYNQHHFTNHMTHGLVALHRLGGDKNRLQRFATCYGSQLLPPENPFNVGHTLVTEENIDQFKGKKENYYGLLQYFEKVLEEKYSGSVGAMINGEYPNLLPGFAGSALHGGIQMGYGLAGESKKSVCEGLAYSVFSYLPITPQAESLDFEFGAGAKSLTEVLQTLRDNKAFQERVKAKAEALVLTSDVGRFTRTATALVTQEADALLEYVKQIQFPAELRDSTSATKWSQDVPRWLLENALHVYTHTVPRNDFFLLHAVTAGWSLSQILPKITTSRHLIDGCKIFTAVLLADYTIQGTPELRGLPEVKITWDEAIPRAMTEDLDAHDFKLLQVAKEVSDTAGDKPEVQDTCLAAASIVLSHPYHFGDPDDE